MAELVRFHTDDGETVLVESQEEEPGVVDASVGDVITDAAASYEAALEQVRRIAGTTLAKLRTLPDNPDELSLEIGVRLSASAGAIIAKTAAQGNLKVTVTWRRDKDE